jgi:uncharacterized membrane protein
MQQIDVVNVAMRWLHLTAAIIAVGGAIFSLFVILPAIKAAPPEVREGLVESVRRRTARLVMFSIAILLLTGFYNYILNEIPAHRGQAFYHGLMGVKIILAMAVFFLASALAGQSPAFEGLRKRRAYWLTINVFLGLAVVAIGSILRAVPDATLR